MPSVSIPVAAAAVTGVTGIAGAAINGSAAQNAAKTQANAEAQAAQIQQEMFNQTRAGLAPYNQAGQTATANLQSMAPFSNPGGTFDFTPTQAQLEATPGYKFNLSQGLQATQNGFAAQGLGSSGAALKGAATYATGLADSTYQNQFANALSKYQTNYNTALGTYNTNVGVQQNLANLGENAAANTGQYGTQTAQNIGQTAVGAANASAAGTVGTANAITGGLNSIGNAYLTNAFLNNNSSAGGIYNTNPAYTNQTGPYGGTPEFY